MTRRYRLKLPLLSTLSALFLLACSNTSQIDKGIKDIPLPTNWQVNQQATKVDNNWLSQFNDRQLHQLVEKALTSNHQLAIQAYNLKIAEQQVIFSGSALWPALDLALRSDRTKNSQTDTYSNTNSIGLNLSYEVDFLGKLNDSQRISHYSYLAKKNEYEHFQQQLVANVVTAWFQVIEAQKLLALYEDRVKNSQHNLAMIESSYNAGLTEALDVYLARNELNSELSLVAAQKTSTAKAIRALEHLIGSYPKGGLVVNSHLPLLNNDIPVGLPSTLIRRKPTLKASWYQLLSQDAALAYAHKQRFPSITLSGSLSDTNTDISDLLSSSSLAWSLLGSVTAPIFNAGRLKANEEKTRLTLKQGEKIYLDALYLAFAEVENAITTEKNLKLSYTAMLAAQENATVAADLSFEQYQSGLVSYTTVLDAKKRAVDAQSSLIKIKLQLLSNRVNLHLALGGSFSTPSIENKAK